MMNAHVIFKEETNKNPTLQNFVIEIIRQMLEENAVERPSPGSHAADTPVPLTGRHLPRTLQPPPDRKKKKVQKECHVCSHTNRRPKKRSDTRYYCHECDAAPCIEPCFEEYHTLMQYYKAYILKEKIINYFVVNCSNLANYFLHYIYSIYKHFL